MPEAPQADAVISNPTDVAVAWKCQKDEFDAPIVIANRYDGVAQKIEHSAAENDVTKVENTLAARSPRMSRSASRSR